MRAKMVKEGINFERGKNPKATMDIGGIDLAEKFKDRLNDLEMEIGGVKVTADEEWYEYVKETLVGKRITAEMVRMQTMDIKTGKMQGTQKRGDFTIEVQDVQLTDNLSDIISSSIQRSIPGIIIADMENNMYQMKMNQKIHFD